MSEDFPRKLYGRRKGPKLSAHKEDLRRTLLPQHALNIVPGLDPKLYFQPPPCGEVEMRSISGGGVSLAPDTAPHPDRLASLTSPTSPQGGGNAPITEVWLEIGFGAGEHMLALARANPSVGLIGAEPYESGVAKLLTHMAENPPSNLKIHEGDARAILSALPDHSIAKVFVLFPDPWPKTRHHKRRFIQSEMLTEFARVLIPGGEFRFASDDAGYLAWTLERALAHADFAWTARSPFDFTVRPASWPPTRYEAKALHGPPIYLSFQRRDKITP